MKSFSPSRHVRGFTFWDLLIVLVTVGLLVALLPMFPRRGSAKAARIACVGNLRSIGLSFRVWANDHRDKLPMSVSTNQGGSLEFVGTNDVFHHFLIISNELRAPKDLTCSTDKSRTRTTNLRTLSDKDLSYFVGLDALETEPQMILSGDRNITTNGRLMSGMLTLTSNTPVRWTKDLHGRCGNVGLADGSSQQVTDATLKSRVTTSPNLPARLDIP